MSYAIHNVDCLDFLRSLPDGSVDAVVTDPPYGVNAVKRGKCFGTSNACKTNDYREAEESVALLAGRTA